MIIGLPKEIKNNESRVALTPAGVFELVKNNHTVYVQEDAGIASGYEDKEYIETGAIILPNIEDVYAKSDMIVKVKEPIEPEYSLAKRRSNYIYLFSFCVE